MRNIRARRRLRFVLTLLFIVCAVLFAENRIEAFVPEAKSFAESRIGDALGGKIKLSIGSIDGGLLHPVTLNDISIKNTGGAAILPSLEISSIKTTYRVWDLVGAMQVKDAVSVSRILSGISRLDVNFITADKRTSGFIRIANSSGELNAKGCANLPSGERIDFSGRIKDGAYNVEIRPKRGIFRIQGVVSKDGSTDANFKAYHLDIGGLDLVCDGVIKSEVISAAGTEAAKPAIQGTIETNNCVLNYKPFLNLKASYRITDGNLYLSDLSISDIFRAAGIFQLQEPFNTNATLTINNLSLSWLAVALGAKDASSIMSGTINAKCGFKGPMTNLRSDIQLEAKKGTISVLDFEYLTARLKGDGPLIRIEDSRITRASGYFVLAGEMDIRKLGRESMFEGIRLVGDDKAINWDGWDSTKAQDTREITMKKRINDDINIDFKKFISEGAVDERYEQGDEVQLEYKLHPNDSLKVMVGQDKEFLGIEHKNKF